MQTALKIAATIAPTETRVAYADVANKLRQMIVSGQLNLGERLPVEAELSRLFQVSRSTVREAIRILNSEHLVEIVRGAGGGTFVTQPKISDVSDILAAMLGLAAGSDGCSIDEIVEARKVLEIWAARQAARREPAEAAARLRATLPSLSARLRADQIFESNYAFHVELFATAGNGVVAALFEPLMSALYHRVTRPPQMRATWRRVITEHHEIAGAINTGDEDEAGKLMAEHLDCSKLLYANLEHK